MNSGWAAKVNDNAAFKNADSAGTYHFPGFGIDAVEALLAAARHPRHRASTRSASTRATRRPSPSTTGCSGADRYGIENVANLVGAAPQGRLVSVGVIPWEEGSGGPCRLLAYG